MCARCDELLAENARLRELLELRTRADLIGRLRTYLGCTEGQARLLLRLYRERGGLVGFPELLAAIPIRYRRELGDGRSSFFLRSIMMQTRAHVPAGAIETVRAHGYRLSALGVEAVAQALSGALLYPEAA